ncbi:hypothetical protein [Streptomyces sp. NPDC058653]|uniref:hypothetical protein n=1 Tax=Streptomyces sp. NPDC058653 TaxID=3346576 RepID=UPI0036659CC9
MAPQRGLHAIDTGDVDGFLGLDVGKGEPRATAVTPIVGFGDDLASGAAPVADRLHGLLTQIHPSLERVLRSQSQHRPSSPCWSGSGPQHGRTPTRQIRLNRQEPSVL